jgi:hypothetical protein
MATHTDTDFLRILHAQEGTHACVPKHPHFGVRAPNLAWYRAGTNDENDFHERITQMVMTGSLFV